MMELEMLGATMVLPFVKRVASENMEVCDRSWHRNLESTITLPHTDIQKNL
jgi:hypothetical protein